jgi:DNA-binding transcriptional regulator YdaS (Cro superfamily)
MFELAGRSLSVGGDWRSAVAAVLKIRPDSVRQLLSGRMEIKPGHFSDLLTAIVYQRQELEQVEQQLRQWLSRQPREDD